MMAYKIKRRKIIHTAKWDRCVKKVRAKGTAISPYAVCSARLKEKSFLKSHKK
jgi:hypothetical protein